MKKAILLTLLTLFVAALPVLADDERHQSYISYDDGGTILRAGEDGSEVEVHRNLPVYPGDEVITARRGRAEVHLSDGNIVGIDRATAIKFVSILDSYEGERDETVAELRYGKVAVYRTDIGRDHVRLDTPNASYVANHESVYSVETDQRGRDRVMVFDGSIEVRTPNRATRLRAGESASVDDRGTYDLVGDQRDSADDFERWFLKRADRFENYNSRYVDRRLGYYADDLDDHGRWVFVTGIGWSWRPFVSVGWRPYYNGYWAHRHGCLTWVSYDPWGWGPFHYGRWAFDSLNGWFWVPGYGYSPAWVYWWYGPSYIGWAPSGWWDCHRPYYDWAYRPYRNHRDFGFGFYGRIRVNEADLRPWTFIDSGDLVSKRVDRAALTADLVKGRLGRSGGTANIYGGAGRFTREDLRDPAGAIKRRGLGGDNSNATGVNTDITGFIARRDPNVDTPVRDRITRGRGSLPTPGGGTTPSRAVSGGGVNRGGKGGTLGGGNLTPTTPTGGIDRRRNDPPSESTTPRDPVRIIGGDRKDNTGRGTDRGESGSGWRDRAGGGDRGSDQPRVITPPPTTTRTPADGERNRASDDSWRNRGRSDDGASSSTGRNDKSGSGSGSSTRDSGSSDVPRRVIDRIGGARVVPRGDGGSGSSTTDSGSSRRSGSSGTRDSGSSRGSGSSTRDGGSRSAPTKVDRPSGGSGSRDSGGSTRSSGSSGSRDSGGSRSSSGSSNSGGNRGDGGKIEKDQ